MGEAYLFGNGGVGGKAFAAISVVYPVGSVCTCTKGSKTLRAKDTSGQFLFLIPEVGTWTVSCTDGTRTISQDVVIQRQYQSEHVSLKYTLYLFKSGSGFVNGFNFGSYTPHPSASSTALTWKGTADSAGNGSFNLTPAVDVTPYSVLKVDLQLTYNYGGNYGSVYGIGNTASIGTYIPNTEFVATARAGAGNRTTISVSLASVSGMKYIKGVSTYAAGSIYNIWLE